MHIKAILSSNAIYAARLETNLTPRKTGVYNGGFKLLILMLFIKSRMDVAQILRGLSYKVCSTTFPKFVIFGFTLVFIMSAIIDQSLSCHKVG